MKKVFLSSLAIATLFACNKEQVQKEVKQMSELQMAHPYELSSPPKDQIRAHIDEFKLEIERVKAGEKSNDAPFSPQNRTIADALWTLEAAVNDYYALPVQEYEELHYDSTYINIPMSEVDSGKVSGSGLTNAYDILISTYNATLQGDENIQFVDIYYINHTNNEVTFGAVSFGGSSSSFTIQEDVFSDSWLVGENLGKCNPTGTGAPNWAKNRLQQVINHNITNNFVYKYNNYSPPGPITWTSVVGYWPSTGSPTNPNPNYTFDNDRMLGHQNDINQIPSPNNNHLKPANYCVSPSLLSDYRDVIWDDMINPQFPIISGGNYLDVKNVIINHSPYFDPVTLGTWYSYQVQQIYYGYPVY